MIKFFSNIVKEAEVCQNFHDVHAANLQWSQISVIYNNMITATKLFADLEAKYLASLIPRKTQQLQVIDSTLISATDFVEIEIQSNIVTIAEGSSTKVR